MYRLALGVPRERREDLERIHRLAVMTPFEVKMRAGGNSCTAHPPDDIAGIYQFARIHPNLMKMSIERGKTIIVLNSYQLPIPCVGIGKHYLPGSNCTNVRIDRRGKVDAIVVPMDFPNRMLAYSIGT